MSFFIFKKKTNNKRQLFAKKINTFLYGKINDKMQSEEIFFDHLPKFLKDNNSEIHFFSKMNIIIQSLSFEGSLYRIYHKDLKDFSIAYFQNKESGINFICDPLNLFDIDGILLQ